MLLHILWSPQAKKLRMNFSTAYTVSSAVRWSHSLSSGSHKGSQHGFPQGQAHVTWESLEFEALGSLCDTRECEASRLRDRECSWEHEASGPLHDLGNMEPLGTIWLGITAYWNVSPVGPSRIVITAHWYAWSACSSRIVITAHGYAWSACSSRIMITAHVYVWSTCSSRIVITAHGYVGSACSSRIVSTAHGYAWSACSSRIVITAHGYVWSACSSRIVITGLPTVTEFQYFVKEMRPWVRKFFWILSKNTEIFCYFSIIVVWKYRNFRKCYWKSWNYGNLLLK